MWSIIFVVLSVAIVGLILVVRMQPSNFRISRSISMSAPASEVFGQVNDFHNWRNWSPWEKMDPDLKRTYEGAPSGTGSVYSWSGNKKVGEGRMTLVESHPSDRIRIKLEFLKPFKATNTAEFTFQSEGGNTRVEWAMTGANESFMSKAFCMVMNMDKMVGKDFEKGLASMKETVEAK